MGAPSENPDIYLALARRTRVPLEPAGSITTRVVLPFGGEIERERQCAFMRGVPFVLW